MTGTNGWTNWTANVTLVAGTNTVQAYAVDTSGNLSPTNTVRFEYVVLQPLAVQVMGLGAVNPKWGTLNPNYTNGTMLAINENYTLTANAAGGFGFTNWTDGSGNPLTNRATLQFTMVTNLTLRANFVDVTKPTLSIVSPTSNQQWTNGTFTMTGKAGDNVAVSTVLYSLNGSGWSNAVTGNGWTNWTANLNLVPGTNTVQACAVDTSGNQSLVSSNAIIYKSSPEIPAALTAPVFGARQYSFVVSGAPGYRYVVEVSTDLMNWVPVETNTAPFTYVDTEAAKFSQRFYRSVYAP